MRTYALLHGVAAGQTVRHERDEQGPPVSKVRP